MWIDYELEAHDHFSVWEEFSLVVDLTAEELKRIITAEGVVFPEITKEQAMRAYIGALIQIRDKYDALYFFACMNLINAYVKTKGDAEGFTKSYNFKQYVARGLEEVIMKRIDGVFIYLERDVAYVSILGLQFSFHNVPLTRILREYMGSRQNIRQEWAGIRLQPPAALIFEWAHFVRSTKGKSLCRRDAIYGR